MVADVVFDHQSGPGSYPLIAVLAGFTHVDGKIDRIAKMNKILNVGLKGVAPVPVTCVHHLAIEFRIPENFKIAVPLCSSQKHDVVVIDRTNGGYCLFVERLQGSIQFGHIISKIGSYRLIQEIVTQNHRFILVPGSYFLPDGDKNFLTFGTGHQPGITVTVVDVVACLTTRGIMHVENQINFGFAAPVQQGIDALKSVLAGREAQVIFLCKQLVMKRQTDGIDSRTLKETDILPRDIVVLEFFPEFVCEVGTCQFPECLVNQTGRARSLETEHISFRVKPVAQINAPD